MTDIVAIETAKAREQAEVLLRRATMFSDYRKELGECVTTALLEAKADALYEYAPNAGCYGYSPHHRLLREAVNARRLRGL